VTSKRATLVAGLGLLIPAAAGLLIAGVPTKLCPLPLLTFVPALLLLRQAAIVVPSVIFFFWSPGLLRGEARVPRRSYFLTAILAVLSVIYFVGSWKLGVQYEGIEHTRLVCIVNIAWVVFLALGFASDWKARPSFKSNLFLHWMLFAWLAWYAFPYLGELT
jgi:hypothetical protein